MSDPLRDELEAYDGQPDTWKPEPGDILDATVLEYDTSDGGKYAPCAICTIRERNTGTLLCVYVSPVVLRREFARTKPRVGERVLIKRLADRGQAKIFRVVVDRPQPDPTVPDFGVSDADDDDSDAAPLTVEDDIPF